MKRFFAFAFVLAIVVSFAQANTPADTINAGKVNYQPIHQGKVVNIVRDSAVIITGVDSLVVVATDTAKNSEKVKVYVDGKVKFVDWLKEGYTTQPDPADTTGQKVIIIATGGDEDDPSDPPMAWYFQLLIGIVSLCGVYSVLRILKIV